MNISIKNYTHVVLVTTLISNISSFLALPFIIFFFSAPDKFGTHIAIILGITYWIQKSGALIGGFIAEKTNPFTIMILGLLIRFPAYLFLGSSENKYIILLGLILSALGTAFTQPTTKGVLVNLCDRSDLAHVFLKRILFANIGVVCGPLIGFFFLHHKNGIHMLNLVAYAYLFCFIINFIYGWILKLYKRKYDKKSKRLSEMLIATIKNKYVWLIGVIYLVSNLFIIQIDTGFPLIMKYYKINLSILFIINGIAIIMLQAVFLKWLKKGNSPLINNGFLFISCLIFYLIYAMNPSLFIIFLSVITAICIFSIGQILIELNTDLQLSKHCEFFNFSTAIVYFMGGIGGYLGSNIAYFILSD